MNNQIIQFSVPTYLLNKNDISRYLLFTKETQLTANGEISSFIIDEVVFFLKYRTKTSTNKGHYRVIFDTEVLLLKYWES